MIQNLSSRIAAALIVIACGFALGAAGKPASNSSAAPRSWNAAVVVTPQGGYIRGNPDAPVKLVEFISYTCPHCAHFEVESDATLQLGFLRTGKGSIEVRPFFRNVIDVTAALLATCGPSTKFFGNHAAILRGQEKWLHQPSQAEIARWSNPDFATRMRAIASDLHLYELMEARGYGRPELDRCLANKPLAEKLANQTNDAVQTLKVQGTPSFLINGELQDGVYSWDGLKPKLEELTR